MHITTAIKIYLVAAGAGLLLQVGAGNTPNLDDVYAKAGLSHDPLYRYRNNHDEVGGKKAINLIFRGKGNDREVFMARGRKDKGLKLPRGTPKEHEPQKEAHTRETFEETGYHHGQLDDLGINREGHEESGGHQKPYTAKAFQLRQHDAVPHQHEKRPKGKWLNVNTALGHLTANSHHDQSALLNDCHSIMCQRESHS